MKNRLEVGQAVVHGTDGSRAAGKQVAEKVLRDVALPPQLVLLFATPELACEEFLMGLKEGFGDGPPVMLGGTTPFPVSSEENVIDQGAVVTLLAAKKEHLNLHVGVGHGVQDNAERAVAVALEMLGLEEIESRRAPGFMLVFTPGFRDDPATGGLRSDSPDCLRALAAQVRDPFALQVFGGAPASLSHAAKRGESIVNYEGLQDSFVAAFVETSLQFGCHLRYGLEPGIATRGRPDDSVREMGLEPYIVEAIPATAVLRVPGILSGEPVFMVGETQYETRFVQALRSANSGGHTFSRPVSPHTILRRVTPVRHRMAHAAEEAAQVARDRSQLRGPRFAMMVSCLGRQEMLSAHGPAFPREEAEAALTQLAGAKLAGFYGAGEHCGLVGTPDADTNYGVGVLVIDDRLASRARLIEKLRVLSRVGTDIQLARGERRIAELVLKALNDVEYQGGMISLVEKDTTRQRRIRGMYARNPVAAGDQHQWESIVQSSVRYLPGDDILALVIDRRVTSPVVIGDSSRDRRCHQPTVKTARTSGQIVFALEDPSHDNSPIGTLQIGIPAGYVASRAELESLRAFAHTVAHSIAVARVMARVQADLRDIYSLERDIVGGHGVDELLQKIVSHALGAVDADWGALYLADLPKSQLLLRTLWCQSTDAAWDHQGMKERIPTHGRGEGRRGSEPWVLAKRRPYRTTGPTPLGAGGDGEREGVAKLSVPVGMGKDVLGVLTVWRSARYFSRAHEFSLALFARLAGAAVMHANALARAGFLADVARVFLGHGAQAQGETPALLDGQLHQVVTIVRNALSCEECSLFLVDPEQPQRLVLRATTSAELRDNVGRGAYRVGEGLTGGIAEFLKPLRLSCAGDETEMQTYYPDFYRAGIRWSGKLKELTDRESDWDFEFLGVPVLWREGNTVNRLGAIRCSGREGARHFFAEDEALLTAVAKMAAIGIEQSRSISSLVRSEAWQRFFVRMSAHDTRKPITFTIGKLDQLRSRLPESDQHLADQCIERLTRMHQLMDNLGTLQQLEGELSRLAPARVSIDDVVREAAQDVMMDEEDEGGSAVKIKAKSKGLHVTGYRVFLVQALINLLSNALRASSAGHAVEVQVFWHDPNERPPSGTFAIGRHSKWALTEWAGGGHLGPARGVVVIAVTNHGSPIAAENMAKIFEPLVTMPTSGERPKAGRNKETRFGLGLAIVWRVAQAHGGTVCLQSLQRKRQTTFSLVLPVLAASESEAGEYVDVNQ